MDEIPVLYLHLIKNIKRCSNVEIIEYDKYVKAIRTVIHKAPAILYFQIAEELERFGAITRINHKFIRLENKKSIDLELKKLEKSIDQNKISSNREVLKQIQDLRAYLKVQKGYIRINEAKAIQRRLNELKQYVFPI